MSPSMAGAQSGRAVAVILAIAAGIHGCDANTLRGVQDIHGNPVDPTTDAQAVASVTLFIESGCPISNRYAPEIRSLHQHYAPKGVNFWLVYPDSDTSVQAIREHMEEYGYAMPALLDPEHALVGRANAQVTPEAAVFAGDGTLVYHGRIDNLYVDISKRRPEATVHDVAEVLDALLDEKASGSATGRSLKRTSQPAFGCYIRDLKQTP